MARAEVACFPMTPLTAVEITSHAERKEERESDVCPLSFSSGSLSICPLCRAGQCLDVVLVIISYSTSVPMGDTQSTTFLRPFNANLAVVSLIEHLAEKGRRREGDRDTNYVKSGNLLS